MVAAADGSEVDDSRLTASGADRASNLIHIPILCWLSWDVREPVDVYKGTKGSIIRTK